MLSDALHVEKHPTLISKKSNQINFKAEFDSDAASFPKINFVMFTKASYNAFSNNTMKNNIKNYIMVKQMTKYTIFLFSSLKVISMAHNAKTI